MKTLRSTDVRNGGYKSPTNPNHIQYSRLKKARLTKESFDGQTRNFIILVFGNPNFQMFRENVFVPTKKAVKKQLTWMDMKKLTL